MVDLATAGFRRIESQVARVDIVDLCDSDNEDYGTSDDVASEVYEAANLVPIRQVGAIERIPINVGMRWKKRPKIVPLSRRISSEKSAVHGWLVKRFGLIAKNSKMFSRCNAFARRSSRGRWLNSKQPSTKPVSH